MSMMHDDSYDSGMRDSRGGGGRRGNGGGPGGRRGGKFARFGGTKAVEPTEPLDYKNIEYLSKFIMPTGKIVGRRRTGFSGQNQRMLANAIKRARFLSLMPYVGRS